MDFRNCIVIMTSNIGSVHLLDGIAPDGTLKEGAREKVMEDLRNHFRPEFLNRVDETVVFLPLRRDQIGKIVEFQLRRLRARLEERKIRLHMSDAARDFGRSSATSSMPWKPRWRVNSSAARSTTARKCISRSRMKTWCLKPDRPRPEQNRSGGAA